MNSRVTFDQDNLILDEIKYCDTDDFENCVEVGVMRANIPNGVDHTFYE